VDTRQTQVAIKALVTEKGAQAEQLTRDNNGALICGQHTSQ